MKKLFLGLAVVTVAVINLASCGPEEEGLKAEAEVENERFELLHKEPNYNEYASDYIVVRDTVTMCQYFQLQDNDAVAITPVLGSDGLPFCPGPHAD